MSESILVQFCSPTLAGMKTGNLFHCSYKDINKLKSQINHWNRKLNPKGVKISLLNFNNNRAQIYVYRPNKLTSDLFNLEAKNLLKKMGYKCNSLEDYIYELSSRLKSCDEFPHEIGLFLGYPLQDVKGFIKNKGKNSKCSGYWKVYTDEYKAKREFTKYRKCTDIYCKKIAEGLSIMRLTVAA